MDFPEDSGVDEEFVLRFGKFGNARRRKDRGGPGTLRYGSRTSPKMVRCYLKKSLDSYRVELELQLRPAPKIFDTAKAPGQLSTQSPTSWRRAMFASPGRDSGTKLHLHYDDALGLTPRGFSPKRGGVPTFHWAARRAFWGDVFRTCTDTSSRCA